MGKKKNPFFCCILNVYARFKRKCWKKKKNRHTLIFETMDWRERWVGGREAGRALTFRKFPEKMDIGPKKCTYRKYVKGGRKIRVMLHFRENSGLWWGIYGKMDKILVT